MTQEIRVKNTTHPVSHLHLILNCEHSTSDWFCDVLPVPADAWREDSDLGAQLQVVAELFGDKVLPWVPIQPGIGVFL